jgi:high affinity sulfate transporter 1
VIVSWRATPIDHPDRAMPVGPRWREGGPTRLFPSLRGYERQWLRGDLLAGLTLWAILVPQALAYASIARVSPVVGLYAAPGALVIYAALGRSRVLVVGPMAATAALSAATVADAVSAGDGRFAAFTAGLALTTGVAALLAGVLRLGFLAEFISQPVLKGFVLGLALTILIGQLPKLFGIHPGTGSFFEQLWTFVTQLGETEALTLVVGTLSLAVIVGLRRLRPGIPGSLVAVAGAIAAVKLLGLDVPTIGSIRSGLPTLGLPDMEAEDAGGLAAGGVGVVLIAFAEGLGAAKAYAARDDGRIDANKELIALGGANLAAGLSSGMVVSGSLSKTAVNASTGARTQVSGLLAGALTVVALLFFTGLFEDLPQATLAAVVIAAVVGLIDLGALVELYGTYTKRLGRQFGWVARPDLLAAVATVLGVLIFGTLPGLFIGIGTSLALLAYRASRPFIAVLGRTPGADGIYRDLERHDDARAADGIVVLRIESGLYFANSENVRSAIVDAGRREGVHTVVLDAETIPFVDVTAARMLVDAHEELRAHGVRLELARDIGQVRDVLGCVARDGELSASYPTIEAAVDAAVRAHHP